MESEKSSLVQYMDQELKSGIVLPYEQQGREESYVPTVQIKSNLSGFISKQSSQYSGGQTFRNNGLINHSISSIQNFQEPIQSLTFSNSNKQSKYGTQSIKVQKCKFSCENNLITYREAEINGSPQFGGRLCSQTAPCSPIKSLNCQNFNNLGANVNQRYQIENQSQQSSMFNIDEELISINQNLLPSSIKQSKRGSVSKLFLNESFMSDFEKLNTSENIILNDSKLEKLSSEYDRTKRSIILYQEVKGLNLQQKSQKQSLTFTAPQIISAKRTATPKSKPTPFYQEKSKLRPPTPVSILLSKKKAGINHNRSKTLILKKKLQNKITIQAPNRGKTKVKQQTSKSPKIQQIQTDSKKNTIKESSPLIFSHAKTPNASQLNKKTKFTISRQKKRDRPITPKHTKTKSNFQQLPKKQLELDNKTCKQKNIQRIRQVQPLQMTPQTSKKVLNSIVNTLFVQEQKSSSNKSTNSSSLSISTARYCIQAIFKKQYDQDCEINSIIQRIRHQEQIEYKRFNALIDMLGKEMFDQRDQTFEILMSQCLDKKCSFENVNQDSDTASTASGGQTKSKSTASCKNPELILSPIGDKQMFMKSRGSSSWLFYLCNKLMCLLLFLMIICMLVIVLFCLENQYSQIKRYQIQEPSMCIEGNDLMKQLKNPLQFNELQGNIVEDLEPVDRLQPCNQCCIILEHFLQPIQVIDGNEVKLQCGQLLLDPNAIKIPADCLGFDFDELLQNKISKLQERQINQQQNQILCSNEEFQDPSHTKIPAECLGFDLGKLLKDRQSQNDIHVIQ